MPRFFETESGSIRVVKPLKVAFTRLCGFDDPRDLVRISWIPTASQIARTGPPAITPVPGEAGFKSTLPAPYFETIGWGIVPLTREDATEMIREIKGYRLLEGYRGQAPVDVSYLEELLLNLSGFVGKNPEVK